VQGRSESRWSVVAHRRGGREARLARGGIREHDAFLGHEMRGPAGTGRGEVSMAGGGRPKRKEGEWGEGPSLAITAMFCSEFACVFRLSVSMRKVASEHPYCVLTYMNSYILHIYYILLMFLSNTCLICDFICLTLALADTHGIAKYARTYIRRYTHTRTHKQNKKK